MASLPSVLVEEKKKRRDKGKEKSKEKEKAQVLASKHEGHGRNEGVDPNWAYQPPDGMVVLDTSQVDENFDWDLLRDDEEKELWIVRMPEGFKAKVLDGLEIQQPLKAPGTKLSTLERKHVKYDIWSVEHFGKQEEGTEDHERPPRGEEVKSLSCLLPRKKKHGKHYLAPKPIAQHIIITHAPAVPNVDSAAAPTPSTRHSVPKHLLKHRFLPFGASSSTDTIRHPADAMEVDVPHETARQGEADDKAVDLPQPVEPERTPKKGGQLAETPSKKRKNVGDSGTPKHKSKKLKV